MLVLSCHWDKVPHILDFKKEMCILAHSFGDSVHSWLTPSGSHIVEGGSSCLVAGKQRDKGGTGEGHAPPQIMLLWTQPHTGPASWSLGAHPWTDLLVNIAPPVIQSPSKHTRDDILYLSHADLEGAGFVPETYYPGGKWRLCVRR